MPDSSRIIADPWLPGALTDGGPVVIAGTGLTMMGLAIACTGRHRDTIVYAVSRHGLLPRPHPGQLPAGRPVWLPGITRTSGPVRLTELMWHVRAAVSVSPASWPDVVDAIRPFIPGLWRRMPEDDKRQFLRHVSRCWEVNRHVVPPATASQITALRCTGRLSVVTARISEVTATGDRLAVHLEPGHRGNTGRTPAGLTAGWLLNATGQGTDIAAAAGPLLRDLFSTRLARPDALRLGLDATTHGALLDSAGTASDLLFTLGPPLRGLWYETTAIPEIRDQAIALAHRITSHHSVRRHRGSAA